MFAVVDVGCGLLLSGVTARDENADDIVPGVVIAENEIAVEFPLLVFAVVVVDEAIDDVVFGIIKDEDDAGIDFNFGRGAFFQRLRRAWKNSRDSFVGDSVQGELSVLAVIVGM